MRGSIRLRIFGGFVGFWGVEKVRGSEKFEREGGLGRMDRPMEPGWSSERWYCCRKFWNTAASEVESRRKTREKKTRKRTDFDF